MRCFVLALVLIILRANATLFDHSVTEWFWQDGVAVGDWLYIAGGESYAPAANGGAVQVSYLYTVAAVKLTDSWTNQTISSSAWTYLNDHMVPVRQPILFHDPVSNQVHRYAGWPYDTLDFSPTLWSFAAGNSTPWWVQSISPNASGLSTTFSAPFAAAYAQSESELFTFGGQIWLDDYNQKISMVPGLTQYNFGSKTWSNDNATIPHQTGLMTHSQMGFTPIFGNQGYLVLVGGLTGTSVQTTFPQLTFVDMSVITLYDIGTKTWYTQTATGDIPPPRAEFCSVASTSSDNKTFELFIYGGTTNTTYDLNNPAQDGYLSVYALSLPAFRWFKTSSSTSVRRASHRCTVIGQSQMLSMGGRSPSTYNNLGVDPDAWAGIGVFDMNAFAWKPHYDASAPAYTKPTVVSTYYNNNYTEPDWSDSSLASIFAFQASTPNSTNTPTPSPTPIPSHTNVGAIAGGVVGGVVGLALLGLLVFWLLHRKKRANPRQEASELKSDPINEAGSTPKYEIEARNSPAYPHDVAAQNHGPMAELPAENASGNLKGGQLARKPVSEPY